MTEDSNLFYKVFNERLAKMESVEGYIRTLGLREKILQEFTSIEKFIMSHF